jgi:hypothetical protein
MKSKSYALLTIISDTKKKTNDIKVDANETKDDSFKIKTYKF